MKAKAGSDAASEPQSTPGPWGRLNERLLPPQAKEYSHEDLRKARLLITCGLGLAGFVFFMIIATFLVGDRRPANFMLIVVIRIVLVVALIANLVWFSRHGKLAFASKCFLTVIIAPLLLVSFMLGGAKSFGIFLVILPPLLCVFFLGFRWGLMGLFATFLYLVVLQLPAVLALTPPARLLYLPHHRVFFCAILASVLVGILWLFESNRLQAVRALEKSFAENMELALARDRALHASKAKSEFLATMSHELRTPLNAIIGYTEILTEDAEEEGLAHYTRDLSRITTAGHHLLALINDVLDLSKIEAGHIDLLYEALPLDDFLQHLRKDADVLMEKKGNAFKLHHDTKSKFYTDPRRLRQILLNLISNAAKFTEQGTISLDVSEHADEEGLAWLHFVITDTGIGMAEDVLERVFERFTQADASSTRKYGGTGLGLAITKELCEIMGGHASVTSTLAKGSSFTIVLPAKPPQSVYRAAMTPSGDLMRVSGEFKLPAPADQIALVIDDEPVVVDLLSRLLRDEGYEVITSSGTQEAFRIAREVKPDLITLDVLMEGVDGWTLLSQIKHEPELSQIPILMITILDERERGLSMGASEFISKPFSRETLRRILRNYRKSSHTNTILIVEDDPDTRDIASKMLAQEGWRIEEAENGQVALEVLEAISPDAILLDLMMPTMDGFQFLEQLRIHRHAHLRQLPVVIFTAKSLTPQEKEQLTQQAQRIFIKGDLQNEESILQQLRAAVRPYLR